MGWVIFWHHLARTAVVHAENSHRPVAQFAGEARAILRLHHVGRVVEVDGRHEIAAVLDKERPHFGEIGRKALVGDGGVVDAHLAEVGIDGGIEHQAVVEDELRIQAAVALQMPVVEVRVNGIDAIEVAQIAGQDIRLELQILPVFDVAKALDLHVLGQPAGDVVVTAGPEDGFAGARDVAAEDDAPSAHLSGVGLGEIEAGKRNPHED